MREEKEIKKDDYISPPASPVCPPLPRRGKWGVASDFYSGATGLSGASVGDFLSDARRLKAPTVDQQRT
jgi:hypothetical protein